MPSTSARRSCALCAAPALFLVEAPHTSGYEPHCRRHMSAVVASACNREYKLHEAGQRTPVSVLPIDQR